MRFLNKAKKIVRGEQGIISLMVVLGVGLFALSTALTAATGVLSEFAKSKNTTSGDQVFYTAETAVNEGFYQFKEKFLDGDDYTGGEGELLNGTSESDITVTSLGWPLYEVEADAENSLTNRFSKNLITIFPEGLAFNYALFAVEDLYVDGSAEVTGNVFSNNDIALKGNAKINGDAGAVNHYCIPGSPTVPYCDNPSNFKDPDDPNDLEDLQDHITGDIDEPLQTIPPPNIDPQFDPDGPGPERSYEQEAIDTGHYYSDLTPPMTPQQAENDIKLGATGTLYVTDSTGPVDMDLHSSSSVDGSLVVMGDLKITGGSFKITDTKKVALFVDGNLDLNGNVVIEGVVYVNGQTTFGGGDYQIKGSLISKHGIKVTGSTSIEFDPEAFDWEEFDGLDMVSSEPPRLIEGNWQEE